MQKTIFTARSARSLTHAFRTQNRRTFATAATKDTTPPHPIEPSKTQAHPIGPYYEACLFDPQPIPAKKPEQPPTSSPKSAGASSSVPQSSSSAPAPAPAPAKRGRKPKEPKSATSPSPSSAPSFTPVSSTAVPDPASSTSTSSSASASAPAASSSTSSETGSNAEVQARARIVFGTRLGGPAERAERLAAARQRSRMVAGVLVPPKPEEPDNCCMSGCVNCVWDRFRDDMEEWVAANSEAEARLRAKEAGVETTEQSMAAATPDTSETETKGQEDAWKKMGVTAPQTKLSKDFWDDELYKDVPVGIREFMKQEKKLKEKHAAEGTSRG